MGKFDDTRDRVAAQFSAAYKEKAVSQFGMEQTDWTDMLTELIRLSFIAGWNARDFMREHEDGDKMIASLTS